MKLTKLPVVLIIPLGLLIVLLVSAVQCLLCLAWMVAWGNGRDWIGSRLFKNNKWMEKVLDL